jgi:membrane protease YdiL (CAAX protease family)
MAASEKPSLLQELHPRRFFLEAWMAIDAEAQKDAEARRAEADGFDMRPLIALASAAVLLALMWYFGREPGYLEFRAWRIETEGPGSFWATVDKGTPYAELAYRFWWSGWRVLGYLLLPMAIIHLALGGRLEDYGLRTKGLREHAPIYALAFLVVLGCVFAVSFFERFTETYPFYHHAGRSGHDLLLWELAYVAQFLSLEFFYRGFLLNALRPSMGSHAIFVMTVPYCMVHFGKPLGETIGAIFAGVFLGTLALRTRSIWSGFFHHVGVAVSMDIASLVQTGRFPTTW